MSSDKFLVVETEYGPVKGLKKDTSLGQEIVSFQKIPFMKPPVGKLRFKAPEKPGKWTEPLDATQEGPPFCQFDFFTMKNAGELDSMHLNVYTRDVNPKELCPVLVWIHGGGFTMGSSRTEFYGPDYFMQKNLVFVAMNYRLGAFGFLSLNDESLKVPGNAGLKDQTMALQWVKNNIQNFGGDPNNITLFGESAGSASVSHHLISEHSKGLFNKAIAMSGTAFNSTYALHPKTDIAERLAKAVGWDAAGGEKAMLEILEKVDPDQIINAYKTLITDEEKYEKNFMFEFGPVIEPYVSESCFIPKHPVLMSREAWGNDIDVVIGGCSNEGIMALGLGEMMKLDVPRMMSTFHLAIHPDLKVKFGSEKSKQYGEKIKKLYYPDSEPSMENYLGFADFQSDLHFWHGIQRAILSRTNSRGKGRTFVYRFDINEGLGFLKLFARNMPDYPGANHGDDLVYLFKLAFGPVPGIDSKHHQHIKMLISWINKFAKNGDPNVPELNLGENNKWEPFTSTNGPIIGLNIGEESKIIELPENERLALWNEIYEAENFEMY